VPGGSGFNAVTLSSGGQKKKSCDESPAATAQGNGIANGK